jgi:hypothetical protein
MRRHANIFLPVHLYASIHGLSSYSMWSISKQSGLSRSTSAAPSSDQLALAEILSLTKVRAHSKTCCFLSNSIHLTMDENGEDRRRAKFTVMEDVQLRQLVAEFGVDNWRHIASLIPGRNARQCRERWKHYLSGSGIPRPWTPQEDQILLEKVQFWGPRWTRIATFFGNRTDIEVKARWIQKFNSVMPLPRRDFHTHRPPPPVPPPAKQPWKKEFASIALPPQVQDWFTHLVSSEP